MDLSAFKQLQVYGSHPPYVLGNFPKVTLEFMCLNSDDPRLAGDVIEHTENIELTNHSVNRQENDLYQLEKL
jgi:hypothetical protein